MRKLRKFSKYVVACTAIVCFIFVARNQTLTSRQIIFSDQNEIHSSQKQKQLNSSINQYLPHPVLYLLPDAENEGLHRYDVKLHLDKYTGMKISDANSKQSSQISMESYIKSYNTTRFGVCSDITRPNFQDIKFVKDTYQHFKTPVGEFGETDTYLMYFYYDDRFLYTGSKFIRTIISIRAIGPTKDKDPEITKRTNAWKHALMFDTEFSSLLWYEGFDNPITVICRQNGAAGLAREIGGANYNQYSVTCPLPEINLLPTHASITNKQCQQASNYLKVIFPRPSRVPGSRDIGVCMASLYGKLEANDIPYFVSWMETLHILGVTEVTMNNALMKISPEMVNVLKYYHTQGRLFLTSYPVAHEGIWRTPSRDDAATESINKIATSDCFYRNMKRYWWTLIIDLDEIPVPMTKTNYADFLEDYIKRNPDHADAHCLTIRSAFFYLEQPPGRPEYGEHLPVLRFTKRFEPEPIGPESHDGIGIAKSFHNPRRVVASGHHIARATHDLKQAQMKRPFMPPEEILVHHYRKTCKYGDDCKTKWNSTINDDYIPKFFGSQLKFRIENVLKIMGYPYN